MKRLRTYFLATAATVSLGSTAHAADWDVTKAPAYANWQGAYIGGNVGVARMNSTCEGTAASEYGYYSCGYGVATVQDTSALAGVQLGYDWQDRNFVYGVAADWDWTGLKHSNSGYYYETAVQTQVPWLSSLRGRAGLAIDNTMVYFTGGVAEGQIKATSTYDGVQYGSINQAKVGWVAGIGIEHQFTSHLSGFAEVLYYDLGNTTGPITYYATYPYQSEYGFEVIAARVGLNFRF